LVKGFNKDGKVLTLSKRITIVKFEFCPILIA
jgi:hypothetical protein